VTSYDEQQLALAAAVGRDTSGIDERVRKLQGATERLNTMATELRRIMADIEWTGDAAEGAKGAFEKLAGAMNEHADAINCVAESDAMTRDPLAQAAFDYVGVTSIDEQGGGAYYGQGNLSRAEYREQQAQIARERLDQAMSQAAARIVEVAAWDLDQPAAPPGVLTGTYPQGATSVPNDGQVHGTVPNGAQVTPNDGQVHGTVPYGTPALPPDDGQVHGTVPNGSVPNTTGPDGLRDPNSAAPGVADPNGRASYLASRLG
jgi:hypothetical protein